MHVYWLEQADTDTPAGDHWLSATERARSYGLRFQNRRADWLLGRWTAKLAVAAAAHLPCDGEELAFLEIRSASSGAPEAFVQGKPAPVVISLSHRAGRAVCAVGPAGTALGCDLELPEPHSAAFVSDFFTAEEQERIARFSQRFRLQSVGLLWSAKESTLKALREGLRLDTRSVAVTLTEPVEPTSGGFWHPLDVRCRDGQAFHGWWQNEGGFLRTLVTAPSAGRPVPLSLR